MFSKKHLERGFVYGIVQNVPQLLTFCRRRQLSTHLSGKDSLFSCHWCVSFQFSLMLKQIDPDAVAGQVVRG